MEFILEQKVLTRENMPAENFDDKTIENAIKFAKLRNVKVYITVNTLVYNDEIDKAILLIKNIYDMGADAIIVQDLGIIDIVRNNLNIPMHASTQMSCNNTYSVKLLEKLGIEKSCSCKRDKH